MKKLLSILGILTLGLPPLVNSTVNTQNINSNFSTFKNSNDEIYEYDPSYPSFTIASEIGSLSTKKEDWTGPDDTGWDQKNGTQSFTWTKYAKDWNSFILAFSKLEISITAKVSGHKAEGTPSFGSRTWDTKKITESTNNASGQIDRNNYTKFWTYAQTYDDGGGGWNWEGAGYYLWRDGNEIKINVACSVGIQDGSAQDYGKADISFTKMTFVSQGTDKIGKLKNDLTKNFSFISNTSPKLDSEEVKSIVDEKEVKSNLTLIKEHVEGTLKASLGNDYEQWMTNISYHLSFDNNNKMIFVKFEDLDGFTFVQKGIFPSSISFKVDLKFDAEGISKKIKDVMEKTFILETGTSPDISDEGTESTSGPVESNHTRVFAEIDKRINQIFQSNPQWINLLRISKNIDDSKNSVIVDFADRGEGRFIENGQWVTQTVMPVNVVLTPEYYEKITKDRLQIIPGKILNPKGTNANETMIDHPSYDNESKTFTYHNEVSLTFTSTRGADEILEVNGVAVPVYKNIFRITLKDLRDTVSHPDPEPTIYDINITKKGESKLKFKIAIDSVSNNINFKWVGWNPVDDPNQPTYYEQYLLTQEKIKDAEGNLIDNPKYNKLINPETGLISNYIFVKGETKYPFALDPLDKEGDKINPDDDNAQERYMKGYIAEGQVANSGIFNLGIDDAKNIDRIERIQLNPQDLSEMGDKETVNPTESQFSEEGLWHYIIYKKDYVEKELNPKDVYNETTPATAGSTIHKLLYLSNQVKDYGEDFMNLSFIKTNANVELFWNSIQSKHLKNYLIPKGIDSKTLELAKYENIISFWYQYVSNVESDKGTPPPVHLKDLSEADEIPLVLVNSTNQNVIKDKIKTKIQEWMKWVYYNAKYGEDYIISDSVNSNKELTDLDLSDFADNLNEEKEINLVVHALNTSTKLVGSKNFRVKNNKDYDEEKVFNLSNLKLLKQVYNYSQISLEDFKNKYIDQFILNELNEQIPLELNPIEYGKDFVYSLQGTNGVDLFQDPTADEQINNFLNTDHEELNVTVYANGSLKLEGSKVLTFTNNFDAPPPPIVKTNISTIFKKLDLGELKDTDGDGYIDKKEIWNVLMRLNDGGLHPDLKLEEFSLKITDLGENNYSATIIALEDNPNYQGQVMAKYFSTVPPNPKDMKTDIAVIFKKLYLDELKDTDGNGYIDKKEIWDALMVLNYGSLHPDLKLDGFSLTITDLGEDNYSVLVVAKEDNPNYQGQVTASYSSYFKPNPEDPEDPEDPDDNDQDNEKFNPVHLAWIIPLSLIGLGLIGFGIYWITRKLKTKHKRMK